MENYQNGEIFQTILRDVSSPPPEKLGRFTGDVDFHPTSRRMVKQKICVSYAREFLSRFPDL